MRKIVVVLAALLFIALNSYAQPGQRGSKQTPEQRAEIQTKKMNKDLILTQTQFPKIKEINLKYAKKFGEIRRNNQGNREVMRNKMKNLYSAKNAELKKVLTAAQYEKYIKLEEERRKNRKNRGQR